MDAAMMFGTLRLLVNSPDILKTAAAAAAAAAAATHSQNTN
jgi:hypothetical protein